MIKNKWKIEMWFRNFSYFIHKIDSEFILEEYLEDYLPKEYRPNFICGKAQPSETIYVSYFINQDEQTVEQHTVECDKTGFFIDEIPKHFIKNKMHYFIDSQSKIDIKDLLNEFIDQGTAILNILALNDLETYFNAYLETINHTTEFAKKIANKAMKEIRKNIELEQIKQQVSYMKNADQVSFLESFKDLKHTILKQHRDLSLKNVDDIIISDFLTRYLIYKEKQDSYVKKDISSINKSQYFKKLVIEGLIRERKSNSQYFEIANSIKPSSHNNNSLNQSDEIDQFRQAVIGISLNLYDHNDTYFKFIRSIMKKSSRKVNLTIDDIIKSKNNIDKFMKKNKLISNNELFYLTTIEDTFHFTLFTAITDLIDKVVNVSSRIIEEASQYDILIALHSLNSLKNELNTIIDKHEENLIRFESLINGYVRNTQLKILVRNTIEQHPELTMKIEDSLISNLNDYNISEIYSRETFNNDYNGILDKLMIQVINDFYKLRLKKLNSASKLYY